MNSLRGLPLLRAEIAIDECCAWCPKRATNTPVLVTAPAQQTFVNGDLRFAGRVLEAWLCVRLGLGRGSFSELLCA
jgi:hypothetical protein